MPCSTPCLEHHLHADADAENGQPTGQATADDDVTADLAQPLHAGGKGAHAGHDEAVGRERPVEVGGELDGGADPLERAHRGPDVAEAVVEHDHPGCAHLDFLARRAIDASMRMALRRPMPWVPIPPGRSATVIWPVRRSSRASGAPESTSPGGRVPSAWASW